MKVADIISHLCTHIYEVEWAGYLYRASRDIGGHLYHIEPQGAKFYASKGDEVRVYECPDVEALLLDIDDQNAEPVLVDGILTAGLPFIQKITGAPDLDDWVNVMDKALPLLTKQYGAVVISGETGAEVWGTPIEVALDMSAKESTDPNAIATII